MSEKNIGAEQGWLASNLQNRCHVKTSNGVEAKTRLDSPIRIENIDDVSYLMASICWKIAGGARSNDFAIENRRYSGSPTESSGARFGREGSRASSALGSVTLRMEPIICFSIGCYFPRH